MLGILLPPFVVGRERGVTVGQTRQRKPSLRDVIAARGRGEVLGVELLQDRPDGVVIGFLLKPVEVPVKTHSGIDGVHHMAQGCFSAGARYLGTLELWRIERGGWQLIEQCERFVGVARTPDGLGGPQVVFDGRAAAGFARSRLVLAAGFPVTASLLGGLRSLGRSGAGVLSKRRTISQPQHHHQREGAPH